MAKSDDKRAIAFAEIFCTNLARARERRGWTQLEFAQKMGVSDVQVSKWERGKITPYLGFAAVLAQVLDVSLDVMFTANHSSLPPTEKERAAAPKPPRSSHDTRRRH